MIACCADTRGSSITMWFNEARPIVVTLRNLWATRSSLSQIRTSRAVLSSNFIESPALLSLLNGFSVFAPNWKRPLRPRCLASAERRVPASLNCSSAGFGNWCRRWIFGRRGRRRYVLFDQVPEHCREHERDQLRAPVFQSHSRAQDGNQLRAPVVHISLFIIAVQQISALDWETFQKRIALNSSPMANGIRRVPSRARLNMRQCSLSGNVSPISRIAELVFWAIVAGEEVRRR